MGSGACVPHQDLLELMGSIPEGKVISATTLRACLAKSYGTEITCPMVTGIFMNVVAQAAEPRGRGGADNPLLAHSESQFRAES